METQTMLVFYREWKVSCLVSPEDAEQYDWYHSCWRPDGVWYPGQRYTLIHLLWCWGVFGALFSLWSALASWWQNSNTCLIVHISYLQPFAETFGTCSPTFAYLFSTLVILHNHFLLYFTKVLLILKWTTADLYLFFIYMCIPILLCFTLLNLFYSVLIFPLFLCYIFISLLLYTASTISPNLLLTYRLPTTTFINLCQLLSCFW